MIQQLQREQDQRIAREGLYHLGSPPPPGGSPRVNRSNSGKQAQDFKGFESHELIFFLNAVSFFTKFGIEHLWGEGNKIVSVMVTASLKGGLTTLKKIMQSLTSSIFTQGHLADKLYV